MSSLLERLKRRNLFRVATVYAVGCWVLLQLADILFPVLGFGDDELRYFLMALLVCFPIVIAVAWWVESSPSGQIDVAESHRSLDLIIIGLLSVALVFFMYGYFQKTADLETSVVTPPAEAPSSLPAEPAMTADLRPSIAVLPFVNMSSDLENEYFSDGLSEELLNVLAQIQGLRVAARTSSFFYKGKNENLQEIGNTLNVDHILEGSVRKSGSKVRITAQLISTSDGFHLWSDTYDREIDDVFAIQDEISREVAEVLTLTLLADGITLPDSRKTTNSEALVVYLRAKEALYTRTRSNIEHAMELFELARNLDPEYAPPLLGIADAALILQNNHGTISLIESTDIAREALQRAADLGYQSSDYWATKGLYHHHLGQYDREELEQAEAAYKQAIALNQNNVNAYIWYATLLTEDRAGRDAEALDLQSKALALDPLNRVVNGNYQLTLARLGQADEALASLEHLTRLSPDYQFYRQAKAFVYISAGQLGDAAAVLATLDRSDIRHIFIASTLLMLMDESDLLVDYLQHVPVDNPGIDIAQGIELALTATRPELVAEAEVLLLQPDFEQFSSTVAFRLIELEEYELVKRLLENSRTEYRKDRPAPYANGSDVAYLMAINELGQKERAQRFARDILDNNRQRGYLGRGKGVEDAACLLILGQREAAIEEMVNAERRGWIGFYQDRLPQQALYLSLREDPRIRSVRQRIDALLERERAQVVETLSRANLINAPI